MRGQVGALEQELCEHRGQREELLSQLDRVTEDQNSACHNSESMASKIQVGHKRLVLVGKHKDS